MTTPMPHGEIYEVVSLAKFGPAAPTVARAVQPPAQTAVGWLGWLGWSFQSSHAGCAPSHVFHLPEVHMTIELAARVRLFTPSHHLGFRNTSGGVDGPWFLDWQQTGHLDAPELLPTGGACSSEFLEETVIWGYASRELPAFESVL